MAAKVTPEAYRDALQRLGLSIIGAAPLLGVTGRTSQRYAADGAPETVRRLLLYIEHYGADLAKEMGR